MDGLVAISAGNGLAEDSSSHRMLEDPPALAVVEELNAVDAAGEGLFVRSVAGFVAAEDLGDVPEFLDAIDDGGFVEAVGGEEFSGALDVVVDDEKARGGEAALFVVLVRRASGTQRERRRFQSRSPAGPEITS